MRITKCLLVLFLVLAACKDTEDKTFSPSPQEPVSVETLIQQAENADAEAQFTLGVRYFLGDGIPQDQPAAIKWWRAAAEQDNAAAQVALGFIYLGYFFESDIAGISEDEPQGFKWLQAAADQGSALAYVGLGLSHLRGDGVPRDETAAAEWFRKAAEQGNKWGQLSLGRAYRHGRGVPKDETAAAEWFRKAAEQGEPKAMASIAQCYWDGKGVPQSDSEALKWAIRVASADWLPATLRAEYQNDLAHLYFEGKKVPLDHKEAAKWWRKAAEDGHTRAQIRLAECYERGEGVSENFEIAYAWYSVAAASGADDESPSYFGRNDERPTRKSRDAVAAKLSSENLSSAQNEATRLYLQTRKRKAKDPHGWEKMIFQELQDAQDISENRVR